MQGTEARERGLLWGSLRARWPGELVLGWDWTVEHFGGQEHTSNLTSQPS